MVVIFIFLLLLLKALDKGILQPSYFAEDFCSFKSISHKLSGEENVAEEIASMEHG